MGSVTTEIKTAEAVVEEPAMVPAQAGPADGQQAATAEAIAEALDPALVARLAAQARAQGVQLLGRGGILRQLTKRFLEAALEAEMDEHPGYDKHDPAGRDGGNSRNGRRGKTLLTEVGPVDITVPRDRDGSFAPTIVPKRSRRLGGVEDLVISLSAKGLTHGEICAHLHEVYGAEVSKDRITAITDRVMDGLNEWQNRPLDSVYPVIFIDCIHVKIRDGQVANRPIYVALAVTADGGRDILGLWAGDGGEGAKWWLRVLTEIRNRGAGDVCMVVCDGLKGLPEAIGEVWPKAVVQTCVVHLIRASLRYASKADWGSSPNSSSRSTPRRPSRPPSTRSPTSRPSGRPSTRRSCGCGPTPGRKWCRSSDSTSRSAGSYVPPTPSKASTPDSAEQSTPEAISPTSNPR
jgi:hypothetical protein